MCSGCSHRFQRCSVRTEARNREDEKECLRNHFLSILRYCLQHTEISIIITIIIGGCIHLSQFFQIKSKRRRADRFWKLLLMSVIYVMRNDTTLLLTFYVYTDVHVSFWNYMNVEKYTQRLTRTHTLNTPLTPCRRHHFYNVSFAQLTNGNVRNIWNSNITLCLS